MNSPEPTKSYAARLQIDYPVTLDRFTSFFRLIWIIPIAIIFVLLTDGGNMCSNPNEIGNTGCGIKQAQDSGVGIMGGLFITTALMIVFRQRYPRWWFDFARELTRFGTRVGAYAALLTDKYPATEEEQAVHLEIDYPDVTTLNRYLPLVKWFLAIPHYIVLAFLAVAAVVVIIIAWFAILFTGVYPRSLFDFIVGVNRWWLRVAAYAFLLVTDEYPPFYMN